MGTRDTRVQSYEHLDICKVWKHVGGVKCVCVCEGGGGGGRLAASCFACIEGFSAITIHGLFTLCSLDY